MRPKAWACVGVVGLVVVACGGTTIDPGDGGGGDSGQTGCGTGCGGGNVCIHPCCGGAPPQCVPVDDAGVCPSGYTQSGQCMGGGQCAPPPCTPPPPYCAPAPAGGMCNQQGTDCYETCA